MDIAAWLRELGLERYEQAFRENEIDAEILPTLTGEDLKDLGVSIVGHRRKLLNTIAALPGSGNPDNAAHEASVVLPEPVSAAPAREAERRQLTVMFVDLVGSTELSSKLDPEETGAIIRAYQNAVAGEITRFEGHVAKYMGDGVLAYFGYPKAHEDEAERAVRAALALADAVSKLATPAGQPLAARVGIATGLVVVGELIGEGSSAEQTVVGETPNLAARLQALAEPGGVAIAASTRRLLGGLFDLAHLGAHHLKGFGAPVEAWRVVGLGAAESRFEAMHATGLTPLLGREHELGLLLDRWELAKSGEGQVALLAGEPGIGKSRLTQALLEQIAAEPHFRLRYYCSPYHNNSALHPVIEQLERAAGFAADDGVDTKLDKLEAMLGRSSDQVAEVAPLLGTLLSILSDGRYPQLNLTPQAQKAKTFEALLAQLEGLAAGQPVLMVLEDAHWIDPSTSELFELVIDRVTRLPVLLVITFRPEFTAPWRGHPRVTSLSLSRLGQRQGAAIVERLTGGKALPDKVLDPILAKTDGVPLFVEELTKTVLESGLLTDAGDHYELAGPIPPLAIPATLHDSLMARLDRLAPVKEVAQVGAVIGREFSYRLVAAVAPLTELKLQEALAQLVHSELVFSRGLPPNATYTFKHTLVRDAAYASLLRSRRQQLHARIARALEERLPDTPATRPELLADHFGAAGLIEQAVTYWQKAGQLALQHSATAEAVSHLEQALSLLGSLPQNRERQEQELDLQVAMGVALIAAKGYAAPETVAAYARARELCAEVGDTSQLVRAHYGQAVVHMLRAEHEAAHETAEALLRVVEHQHDRALLLMGHRLVGASFYHLGRFNPAQEHLKRAMALYDPEQHRSLAFLYAEDPGVAALCWLSWTLFVLGFPDQACAHSRDALNRAHEFRHRNTFAYALVWDGVRAQLCRDCGPAEGRAKELVSLAAEHGFPLWLALGTILQGWTLTEAGRVEEGLELLRKGLDAWRATGAEGWVPYFLVLLADGNLKANQATEGLKLVSEALLKVKESGARWIEAELHRLRGELLLATPDGHREEAEACFHAAIEIARGQSAKSWELRAASSLARLWRDQGKHTDARNLLVPIYDWFTEGFETADLKNAKALLDDLA